MKRNRATVAHSNIPDPPTKTQKRCKDLSAKGSARERPAGAEKPCNNEDSGSKRAATATAVTEHHHDDEVMEMHAWLDGPSDLSWLWDWGVEEELLLGWFPFDDEHFLCSENRGGSGLFWEEDHDIWQLQHIHEIPNSAK